MLPLPAGSNQTEQVSAVVDALRAGDRDAAAGLWTRYFARMTALARSRLPRATRAAADEEDVALSAFRSFCRMAAIGEGQGAAPVDRTRPWGLLAAITCHKAARVVAREGRLKRGGGWTRSDPAGLSEVAATDPAPDAAAAAADDIRRLLDGLGDPDIQAVALLRVEGYSIDEIAARLGCTRRTVDRRLRVIRCALAGEGEPC